MQTADVILTYLTTLFIGVCVGIVGTLLFFKIRAFCNRIHLTIDEVN
jgi:hypothetical protein